MLLPRDIEKLNIIIRHVRNVRKLFSWLMADHWLYSVQFRIVIMPKVAPPGIGIQSAMELGPEDICAGVSKKTIKAHK